MPHEWQYLFHSRMWELLVANLSATFGSAIFLAIHLVQD